MRVKVDHSALTTHLNYSIVHFTMDVTKLHMDMHKSKPWLYYQLSIHTLGLVLRSGVTITSPDPKADAKLQVTSGVHHGGTIKVIVVRPTGQKRKPIDD